MEWQTLPMSQKKPSEQLGTNRLIYISMHAVLPQLRCNVKERKRHRHLRWKTERDRTFVVDRKWGPGGGGLSWCLSSPGALEGNERGERIVVRVFVVRA